MDEQRQPLIPADLARVLRPQSTDADVRGYVRKYLALAPDPERILDAEERDELAADTAEQIKVAILTLAPAYQGPEPTREEQDAAWWAEVEKWATE